MGSLDGKITRGKVSNEDELAAWLHLNETPSTFEEYPNTICIFQNVLFPLQLTGPLKLSNLGIPNKTIT
jgi:hypothetical protein